MNKTKITELLSEKENTKTRSLAFDNVHAFWYLGAILSKNNNWAKEIGIRLIKVKIKHNSL